MTDPVRPRILVDCDPGHDDAIMLICAAAYADVVGITTVSGNVGLHHTTRNALAVARLLDWDVPVHEGAARPLLADPIDAAEVHGESGMDGTNLPAPDRQAGPDGVGFLLDATRAEEGLWLVATGPLTNVALALRRDPGFASRLAGICLMGGGALGGNVTAAAEFNVYADPEAAAIVFGADCTVRMCGLDLTHQVTGNQALLDRLATVGGPAAVLVTEIIATELAAFGRYASSSTEPPLHDPVALLAVTHPHLFTEQATPIHVETAGNLSRGATLVDRRIFTAQGTRPSESGARTRWVHTVDAPAALDLIVEACALWA
ncbi:nucleoside hydrolase [Aquihabitans sp. McL0605]|uniref:nucleoside hydrolase n=1 Tax=Aquihabitans sp. McL0605 TaxID=3415671 RepID=UPI003CECC8C1